MEYTDTEKLLRECDSGTKMAVASIDEVIDRARDIKLRELLEKSRDHHEKLGNEIHVRLLEHEVEEKDPNLMAKGMSWLKTNMKVNTEEDPDSAIADVMTDGCDMGVKSLYRYLNQYKNADDISKDYTRKLIKIEEQLCRDLREFL